METRLATPTNEARGRPAEKLVDDFKEIIQRAEQKAVERAKAADQLVRNHPYQTMGLAVGIGVIISLLAGRKWRS